MNGSLRNLFAALLIAGTSSAEGLRSRELRIPMEEAGPRGLEALLVAPDEPGPHPLALISHGSPRNAAERREMTPAQLLPQAREFARRGWAAVIVMRRGYGDSGGGWAEAYGSCADADFIAAAGAQTADLRAAVTHLATLPEIDAGRILAVGHSAGGFATIALTADPPPGLAAAVVFAGGRGSTSDGVFCGKDALLAAYREFGRSSKTPMLWVYAQNDRFFGPEAAREFRAAFEEGGGKVKFVQTGAFGEDGHSLFSAGGIPVWTPLVDDFLRSRGLVLRERPLAPPAPPDLKPPLPLGRQAAAAWAKYLLSPPHKAFAASEDGRAYGWRSGRRTAEEAGDAATAQCPDPSCAVIAVDDRAEPGR
jgi:dienelactone hydrolase